MQLVRHIGSLAPSLRGAAVALGNFDGLHPGHQAILDDTMRRARALSVPAAVMTFAPHPREFFNPGAPSLRLMRLSDKLAALRAQRFDAVFLLRFDARLAATTAEDFISGMLAGALGVGHVTTGENFRFGAKRQGDSALLADASRRFGFSYHAVAPVAGDAGVISSSAIRALMQEGNITAARQLLGRPPCITGHVAHGDKRGRLLGFPTANILLGRLFVPRRGVYAVQAEVDGRRIRGVANIGMRPTFGGTRPQMEVHLFDFSGDIYGQRLSVELHSFLRDEQRFDSVEALKTQIAHDCEQARNL